MEVEGGAATLIDERQTTFIEGQHLLPSTLIANEVIHEAKSRNRPSLVFKADFEKAYDSVSWDFLPYMWRRMVFCEKWISWIEGCLKSASISILINDSPSSEFIPQRGLRQGDPVAPLLFNVVAEGLNGLMREAMKKNLFQGFLVVRDEVEVSILHYANDTLFFGKTSMENVKAIKVILRSVELVSGLKINFSKSNFETIGMLENWKVDAARYLNCRLLTIPFLYLGLSIGTNPRRFDTWDPIVKKCERKLAKWKQKLLSFGGSVTLIKSFLNSIPIYFLSFFKAPNKVLDKLVWIQRRFLWGGGVEEKKIAWVKWESVCLPKDLRKFNMHSLESGNGAFSITKENCGLEYWTQNMAIGEVWRE